MKSKYTDIKNSGIMTQEQTASKVAQSIISNQIALDFNEQIKHTNLYSRDLKNRLNLAQKELLKSEVLFDELYNTHLESTQAVYEIQTEMTKELCSLGFKEFQNVTTLLKAYKKDSKSIEGIVKKVLR